jgi:hypothetical protein
VVRAFSRDTNRCPWARYVEQRNKKAARCAVPQHGVELGFGDSEPFRCQLTLSAGDWWVWCSPDVVDGVVPHLALDFSGATDVWILGEDGVDRSTVTDDFCAGELAAWAGTDNDVQ